MKTKEQLYFKSIDDTLCAPLDGYINDARIEGLSEITLVEAIPDPNNPDYIWCTWNGDVIHRTECKKSQCSYYEANKSGRGTCIHRGMLYNHGKEVKFIVNESPLPEPPTKK